MSSEEVELTAPLLFTIVTFGLILLHMIIRIGCGRPTPDITMFYDEANALSYRNQYIVRLLYGPKSMSYDDTCTTIFVEVEHSINRIVKIPFTPATMGRVFSYKGHRCAKIFIRTSDRYSNISKLLMYHNGRGSIVVVALELQDIDAENSIAAVVNNPVFGANHAAKVTSFPFGREQSNPLEEDIRPTRNVTISESIFFFYVAVNAIYLATIMLLNRNCTKQFCSIPHGFLHGVSAGGIGFGVFVGSIVVFRYLIKRCYHYQVGRGCSKFLRILYLGLVVCAGVAIGAVCSQLSIDPKGVFRNQVNRQGKNVTPNIIWSVTALFGIFCLITFIGLAIPLAVYLQFILLPEDDTEGGFLAKFPVHGRRYTRTQTETFTRSVRKFKSAEAYSAASAYAEETSQYQSTTNSPSCSQNKGVKRQHQVDQRSPRDVPTNSTDEKGKKKKNRGGYAHILATQQKKVHSISQYEEEQPVAQSDRSRGGSDARKRSPRPTPSPHRRQEHGNNNKKKKGPSGRGHERVNQAQRAPSPASVVEPKSSLGENYYAAMMKVTKVKSVSQYM